MYFHLLTLLLSTTPLLSLAAPTTPQARQVSPPALPYPDNESAETCPTAGADQTVSLGPFIPLRTQHSALNGVSFGTTRRLPWQRRAAPDGPPACLRIATVPFTNQDVAIRTQIVRLLPGVLYVFTAAADVPIGSMVARLNGRVGTTQPFRAYDVVEVVQPELNQATMEFIVDEATELYFTMTFEKKASGEVGLFSVGPGV